MTLNKLMNKTQSRYSDSILAHIQFVYLSQTRSSEVPLVGLQRLLKQTQAHILSALLFIT